MVQSLQAAPGFRARGHIDQREQNSSYNLQHEDSQGRAAKHVPPTGGISRHRMFGHFTDRRRKLEAAIKPGSDLCKRDFRIHDAHGGLSPVSWAIAAPGVGSSPAWMVTRPLSILYGYSKRPRSGGPEAREPSR